MKNAQNNCPAGFSWVGAPALHMFSSTSFLSDLLERNFKRSTHFPLT